MAVEEGKIVIVIHTTELRVQPVFRGQYGFASGFIRCLCSEVYWIVGIPRSIPLFSSIQRERKEKKQAITGKNCAISDYGHVCIVHELSWIELTRFGELEKFESNLDL